jgi:predicted GNAT superfamily acetyltransferase
MNAHLRREEHSYFYRRAHERYALFSEPKHSRIGYKLKLEKRDEAACESCGITEPFYNSHMDFRVRFVTESSQLKVLTGGEYS